MRPCTAGKAVRHLARKDHEPEGKTYMEDQPLPTVSIGQHPERERNYWWLKTVLQSHQYQQESA